MSNPAYKPPSETSPGRPLSGMSAEVGILERERAFSSAGVAGAAATSAATSSQAAAVSLQKQIDAKTLTVKDAGAGLAADVVEIDFAGAVVSNPSAGKALVSITGGSGSTGLRTATPPALASFAWINQGSATAVQHPDGSITLSQPPSGNSYSILKLAAPATPYTLTVGFLPRLRNANFQQLAALFRESSSGKMHVAALYDSSGQFQVQSEKWASPTSDAGNYAGTTNLYNASPFFLQIKDDGTNRTTAWSADGWSFDPISTTARTDYLTADEIGFGVNCVGAPNPVAMTVISWIVE